MFAKVIEVINSQTVKIDRRSTVRLNQRFLVYGKTENVEGWAIEPVRGTGKIVALTLQGAIVESDSQPFVNPQVGDFVKPI